MDKKLYIFATIALVFGCGTAPVDIDDLDWGQSPIEPGSPAARGVLGLVNDAETTLTLLDDAVGLDRRAATGIITHRDGADGRAGTADDQPFASLAELDAVPYVGPSALQRLLDWALAHGYVPEESPVDEAAVILAFVNDPATTFVLLDKTVNLDRRAAEGIAAGKPFATVAELDAVPYVGPSTLQALLAFALAHGYGDPSAPCVIISEIIEGAGNNNKAVEVFNCGSAAVALDDISLCLVRNDDSTCTYGAPLGATTLAPGAVWTVCRTTAGTFNDPIDTLRNACDQPLGIVATFNGDDRLVLFLDADGDGKYDPSADTWLDGLGEPGQRPSTSPWQDKDLRRCNVAPYASGTYDHHAYFTEHPRGDATHLGVPPEGSCDAAPQPEPSLGNAGDDCVNDASCATTLRCFGVPHDGSASIGKCVDPTPVPGEGAACDRYAPCQDGTMCAGTTLWGEGNCVPYWMAGTWGANPGQLIREDQPLSSSVVVYGLASVPVDITVMAHFEHSRGQDLRVTLEDPNGDTAVLWQNDATTSGWARSFVTTGISRDDAVNGRWTLTVEDLVSGEIGVLHSWSLFIVSRWD